MSLLAARTGSTRAKRHRSASVPFPSPLIRDRALLAALRSTKSAAWLRDAGTRRQANRSSSTIAGRRSFGKSPSASGAPSATAATIATPLNQTSPNGLVLQRRPAGAAAPTSRSGATRPGPASARRKRSTTTGPRSPGPSGDRRPRCPASSIVVPPPAPTQARRPSPDRQRRANNRRLSEATAERDRRTSQLRPNHVDAGPTVRVCQGGSK